jgi:uncharacterized protein YutE (UPF0331/DUF86 family)
MILFSMLDGVIDLADEIVAARGFGVPSTYREIFVLLARNGCITKDMLGRYVGPHVYRNHLAHEYGEITAEDLLRILQMTDEIRSFVDQMKNLVREGSARRS